MDQTEKDINKIVRKMQMFEKAIGGEKIEKILYESAIPAKSILQKNTPKDSGNLRKSIQIFKAKKAKSSAALVGPVVNQGSGVKKLKGGGNVKRKYDGFYWRFLEFGTVHIDPIRFIEKSRKQSQTVVLAKLKSSIEKHTKKEIQKFF